MKKFAYLASAMLIVGCGKDTTPPIVKKEPPIVQAVKTEEFVLSDSEIKLVTLMAERDLLEYLTTEKETLTERLIKSKKYPEIIRISSRKYQEDYNSNEVKGDSLYLGKTIGIKGTVLSIDKSFNDIYSIGLDGTDGIWRHPRAIMQDEYTNWMAELKKGQKISLVCNGGGLWAGNAILKQCAPSNFYARINAEELSKLIFGNSYEDDLVKIFLFGIYHSKHKDSCLKQGENITECQGARDGIKFSNDFMDYLNKNKEQMKEKYGGTDKNMDKMVIEGYHNYLKSNNIKIAPKEQARAEYLIVKFFQNLKKQTTTGEKSKTEQHKQ